MSRDGTGSSSPFEATRSANLGLKPQNRASAGLVLLYARRFEQLRPAYPLASPCVVIGRDGNAANIIVPEQAVSRRHALVAWDGRRWTLSDLGSRNGTMLDGAFLSGGIELEHGQQI